MKRLLKTICPAAARLTIAAKRTLPPSPPSPPPHRRRSVLLRQRLLDMAGEDVFGWPLAVERDFRRHLPFGPHSLADHRQCLQRVADGIGDRRRLVAALDHAV